MELSGVTIGHINTGAEGSVAAVNRGWPPEWAPKPLVGGPRKYEMMCGGER